MKDHPEWWMSVDHPTDVHLMPNASFDRVHRARMADGTDDGHGPMHKRCWCNPERWEKDPRIVLHFPSGWK